MEEFVKGVSRVIRFFVWVIVGVFLVPCMVITSIFYPVWEKMGDNI